MFHSTPKRVSTWGIVLLVVLAAHVAVFDGPGLESLARGAPADEAARAAEFFAKKVRPILESNCYKCHSHTSGKNKGELVVDSQAALLKGGGRGPALVAGQPEKSLLIRAVAYEDEELRMPPKGKLSDEQVAVLREWVKMGAPWPGGSSKSGARAPGKITEEDRRFWSFQPVREPPLPEPTPASWAKNPIDCFIGKRLQAEGLAPAPPAERSALIRRVFFDLIGLPPTPGESDAFLNDAAPDAYEKLVDRLLSSPRYGERWARHWLDLVRYAESDGFRLDAYRPHVWRYRDYVIRSFNEDKPYDRFVREQLAGDELAPGDPEALVATGFLRHGIYEYNNSDVRGQWQDMLNELTDVTSDVFLGLGMGCARCHDHKFDPILQKDYYRLQAFFAGVMPRDDLSLATPEQRESHRKRQESWEKKTADVRGRIEALAAPAREKAQRDIVAKYPEDIQGMMRKPGTERGPLETQLAAFAYRQVDYEYARLERHVKDEDKLRFIQLRKELASFDADKPEPLPVASAVRDVGPAAPPTVIPKKSRGDAIEPGFLTLFDDKPAAVTAGPVSTGRRAALARWLTQPEHPLTARVMVNRLWQHHFGRGLVATASDYGHLGGKPSHPELLDWLAARFVKEGWSFKKMHRLMLTSAVYQQSATQAPSAAARLRDPENRLLWRMSPRRLEAEQIRDALLSVTGQRDDRMAGPAVETSQPRRTIYTVVRRNTRDQLLEVFDVPEGIGSMPERNVSTTPTQSLLMINSPYLLRQAQALAERLRREMPGDERAQVDAAYRLVFGRTPNERERKASLEFLQRQAERIDARVDTAAAFQFDPLPHRGGQAALVKPGKNRSRLEVPDSPKFPEGDFTLEAFVQLRSTYADANVRPIAACWKDERRTSGWTFGVTGEKSDFKPHELVLQLWGRDANDAGKQEAVFSSLQIDLNKPYFVAVAFKLDDTSKSGVTFYAKDLSNDDEPMQTAPGAHTITQLPSGPAAFTIGGGADRDQESSWDGLIDDVRLSKDVLPAEKMLLTPEGTGDEGVTDKTAGFWRFEPNPGMLRDSSGNGLHIVPRGSKTLAATPADARLSALADFCHVLLNANEFLYVD